jgi:hypothetical protein
VYVAENILLFTHFGLNSHFGSNIPILPRESYLKIFSNVWGRCKITATNAVGKYANAMRQHMPQATYDPSFSAAKDLLRPSYHHCRLLYQLFLCGALDTAGARKGDLDKKNARIGERLISAARGFRAGFYEFRCGGSSLLSPV